MKFKKNCGYIYVISFLCLFSIDIPVVVGMEPRIYLAKGMQGRLDCPTDANPPVSGVRWTKDGSNLQHLDVQRLKVTMSRTLHFHTRVCNIHLFSLVFCLD